MGCGFSKAGNDLSDIKFAMIKVGDKVVSAYGGAGEVKEVRENKDLGVTHYVVTLDKWKLAQGQSPTQYLQRDGIKQIL